MTKEDLVFLSEIREYSEKVLGNIDPQKVQVSKQLEALMPIMKKLSKEKNMAIEDVFIKYMDLSSEFHVMEEQKFKDLIDN